MPADKNLVRECRCTQCARTPEGYKPLKYGTYYKHRKAEEALQSRLRYQANTEAARIRNQEQRPASPRRNSLDAHRDSDDIFSRLNGFSPPHEATEPEPTNTPGTPPSAPWSPTPPPPPNPPTPPPPNPPIPPRLPSPLTIDYDSDESDSDYVLLDAAFLDPPSLRLAYLNAMSDHIIRKHPVRDVEITLRNSLNSLLLVPGAIPPHITPLTTLKSVRRHLGLNESSLLRIIPVCAKCYKRYTIAEVLDPELSMSCTRERPPCNGVFAKTIIKNRRETRVPEKVVIYSKITASLRHMFLRPSFVRALLDGSVANALIRAPNTLYDVCDGKAWGAARIGLRRVFCQDGSVSDEPTTPGSDVFVTSLGYGLFAALNIDWFSLTKKRSCGAIYLAILNLPRQVRYQIQNVILACMISGPHEPSLESLNFVFEPIVEVFKQLYAGVVMRIYNEDLPATVHVYPLMDDADVPGRAKAQGLPSHSHSKRIGCDCNACQNDVNKVKGYDSKEFIYHDEWHILQLAWQATRSQAARNRIARDHGIRWSALNELPGWMPHGSAPFDPMHCLYLGIVNSLWCNVIEDGYLLSTQQKSRFADFLSGLRWPSQIGRLPSPTTSALNRRKADEWRRLISILPVALWVAWRNNSDKVGLAPSVPEQATNKPTFTRDLGALWDCIVYLTVSIRLFTSWIAYLPDIDRARDYMEYYCRGLLRLRVRLQPNHHFAMHLRQYIHAYGPCYGWWLFPYERFNGILETIETNGHPDEAETILARWWVRVHQLHNYLERLPEEATPAERAVLQQLCSYGEERGTLLSMTESLHGQEPVIKTSAVRSRFVDLRELDDTGEIYLAVLEFAQRHWPDLNLVSDLDLGNPNGRLFLSGRSAKPLQFVHRNTVRYGCETSLRTDADQFALILGGDGCRYPVKILRHFQLEVASQEPVTCTVVSRLDMNDVPLMPWSLHADDLGYYVAIDNSFEPPEAISPGQLVSAVTTGAFQMLGTGQQLRIVVAYDRTGCEIFEGFDEEVGA